MGVRIVNDDPRCLHPDDCQIAHASKSKLCMPCKTKGKAARIAAKAAAIPKRWACPAGFEDLYVTLVRKVGRSHARRLVAEEKARADRKAGGSQSETEKGLV